MAINLKANSKELGETRTKLLSDARSFLDANETNWTKEAESKYDAIMADASLIADTLAKRQAFQDRLAVDGKGIPGKGVLVDANGIAHRVFGKDESIQSSYGGGQKSDLDGYAKDVPNLLGHFICSRVSGNRLSPELRGMFAGVDTQTGASVMRPETYGGTIDRARAQSAFIRAGATTLVMATDDVRLGRRENIVTPEVKAELTAFTAQRMTFGHVMLRSFTIGSLYELSREWVDGTANAAELVDAAISADLAAAIDKFALQGTGSNQPTGLTNIAGISSAAGGAVDWTDFAAAGTVIRNANHEPTAAILNPTIRDVMFDKETGDGVNAARGFLGAPPTLKNVNFLATTNMPSANAVIGDFSKAIWGVRSEMMIESTTTGGDSFEKHSVLVKVVFRGDIGVTDPTAFYKFTALTAS